MQTSNKTCTACASGLSTASTGATSPDACVVVPYICPAGMQPSKVPALVAADCVPLVCANGLSNATSAAGCKGCPAGTAGLPPACSICNASMTVCPGLMSYPLPSSRTLLSALSALRSSKGATIPAALQSTPPGRARLLQAGGGGGGNAGGCAALATAAEPYWAADAPAALVAPSGSFLNSEVLIGVVAGCFGAAILLLGLLAMKALPDAAATLVAKRAAPSATTSAGCCHRSGALMRKVTVAVDQFALQHKVDRRKSPVYEPTPLGGTCSLLGFLALAALWAILIVQRVQNNISRQTAVDAASRQQLQLASTSAQVTSATGLSGIHIVLHAVGEPGE